MTFRSIMFVDGGPMQYRQMVWDGPAWFEVVEIPDEALKPLAAAEPRPVKQRRGIYREGEQQWSGVIEFKWCGWNDDASVDTHPEGGDSTDIEAPSLMGSAVLR